MFFIGNLHVFIVKENCGEVLGWDVGMIGENFMGVFGGMFSVVYTQGVHM